MLVGQLLLLLLLLSCGGDVHPLCLNSLFIILVSLSVILSGPEEGRRVGGWMNIPGQAGDNTVSDSFRWTEIQVHQME